MPKDVAIAVENVSKTFRIPHEKITSLRGAAVSAFKKKTYEEFKALDGVSFEVKKGEFFGIIGRNGSGKSTLLKILAGIYQPDKGRIQINGRISPFLELGIGFNPELSGRDNVYLNATVLGLTKKEIDKKFDSIVKFSELERFIDQKLKNYSSGMQVRLAFSVSIHANRDILLMDEVLAVGDTNFQSKCLEEFNKYKDMGRTVIIVTHDIAVVQRYCDRAMLLRNGKIKKIGKADEVANAYIYDNMDDEDRRIFENEENNFPMVEGNLEKVKVEESEEEKSKIGNKKIVQKKRKENTIEIVNVDFLDSSGKKKNVFGTEDDIFISINFKKNKNLKENFNIRVSIETEDGYYLFGYDTNSDKFEIQNDKNTLFFKLIKNCFLQGLFFVNVSCFGSQDLKQIDFKPRIGYFKVYSLRNKTLYKGILNVEHLWE